MSEINNCDNKKWGSDLPLPNYLNATSEIKPVYQAKRFDDAGWADVTQESYKNCELAQTILETRILYPAAAYEALKAENERLRQESANYENASKITNNWNLEIANANGNLRQENEALKARIFELEKTWTDSGKLHATLLKLGYDRGLALHIAGATDYDQLKAENEAQAKRIAELESTLEDIADGKPKLMQSDFGHEFFCYQYNPTEKARKALFASKISAASKNGDSK